METQISTGAFALINIVVVFTVLILLAGVIQLTSFLVNKKPKTEKKTLATEPVQRTEELPVEESSSKGDISLKVAAACAAVAASLDGVPHRIVSIKRATSQNRNLWSQYARMENMSSNAMLRNRR